MLQYFTYSLWVIFWFTSDSLMNKKLFRFITSSIISISVIACNLPNNSTKTNSKLDSSLNKLSDSNNNDSEISHDSDKLSKALSKDKNFFTRENKNSFKTLANHNDIECNPSGLATPEDCICEDSPNTLPDTSLPLTPESMGALNNELDIAKSPEAQELENFHSNLGKIHELENGVNQINAYLAQDKKDKAELEKQKNNPSFSTQSVKNNNKDKASKDKSDPRPHDCKAQNPLDCFNTIDEKLAYLDKHIKLLEAKLVKEQTKLTSAQAKQDDLFNKIDSSYRPYLISTGKKIREAARALNAKLYPRVNLFSTSNHNKRMDRLELFFNSSKLDFDFYVSAKNTYEMSKAGSVIGREFYIFDDMVYLFIRDGLTNADPTKYNVLASIKKYTRQIEEHLKQYKKENKKLIEYINKLKAQINSQGFRVQAESQAVADYNNATNSKPCPVPSPSPSPSGSPSPSPSQDCEKDLKDFNKEINNVSDELDKLIALSNYAVSAGQNVDNEDDSNFTINSFSVKKVVECGIATNCDDISNTYRTTPTEEELSESQNVINQISLIVVEQAAISAITGGLGTLASLSGKTLMLVLRSEKVSSWLTKASLKVKSLLPAKDACLTPAYASETIASAKQAKSFINTITDKANSFVKSVGKGSGGGIYSIKYISSLLKNFKVGVLKDVLLRDSTHAEIARLLEKNGFVVSDHIIARIKDIRTTNLGIKTFGDLEQLFKNLQFTGFQEKIKAVFEYKSFKLIVNVETGKIITLSPI